jgi:hypothetical protein
MIMEYTYMLTFEETSGYTRPEWVNKWPNSMTYMTMMMMTTYMMMKLSA